MTTRYLRCLHEGRSGGGALVCFPHAGGGPSSFLRWASHCREGVGLYAAQLPGREVRIHEPFATDLKAVARQVALDVSELEGSVAFFGHSMGALVAYETAQRLATIGKEPRIVVVSAAPAPHVASRSARIHDLEDGEFLRVLGERYGALPKEILSDPASSAFYAALLRSDMTMLEEYAFTPGAALTCELRVSYGSEDRGLDVEMLERWQELSGGPFSIEHYPGGHFYHYAHGAELVRRFEQAVATRLEGSALRGELHHAP